MKSIEERKLGLTFTFKCSCGAVEFYRPKVMKLCSSFFEGYFKCSQCKKKHDYCSNSFTRHETQTSLF